MTFYEHDDSRFPPPCVGDVVWREGQRVILTRVVPVGQHRFAGGRDSDYSHWDGYDCEAREATAQEVLDAAQREACPWPRVRRTALETGFELDIQGLGVFHGRTTLSVCVGGSRWVDLAGFASLAEARVAASQVDGATHGYAYCYHASDVAPFYREFVRIPEQQ